MKSLKISSDKSKPSKLDSIKVEKSQSTEVLNGKVAGIKSGKTKIKGKSETIKDRELAEIAFRDEFGTAFEKFWKTVTDGMEKQQQQPPHESVPRSNLIEGKITEIQKRIRLNQLVLKRAGDRMKEINFAAERENLSKWKEGLAFRNPSREDLNRFKDVKALDLEMEKLREGKPDRNVFLKSSPGIVNFHETMETTLNMLDRIQKSDDLEDSDLSYRDINSEFNLDFIKAPNLVMVSDEE